MTEAKAAVAGSASQFTGSIPQIYDRNLAPIIFVDHAALLAQRVAALAPTRVLETASGTGILSRALRDRLPASTHLTATDLNPPMLEVARGKFTDQDAITFQQAEAQSLPFPDGSFDAVVCQFGVMFYPDKQTSFQEAYRVLTPGGRYLFSVWDSLDRAPFARLADAVLRRAFPIDPPTFFRVPCGYALIDLVRDTAEYAGFTDLSAAVVRIEKPIPDPAAFAYALLHGNPAFEQVRARGGDPQQIADTLAADLRSELDARNGIMPLQAIVFSATKR